MSATWKFACPWCRYYVEVAVNACRGGEDAARLMVDHVEGVHDKTWQQFLWADPVEVPGGQVR